MSVDPNQVIDSAATVAKDAIAADKKVGGKALGFLKSKEFWLNVVGVAGAYTGYIPSPFAPYVIVGVNLLLHYLSQ